MCFCGIWNHHERVRLYDSLRKKIVHSRDVIFNEQKYGFDEMSESQKKPKVRVYLEYSDEPSELVNPSTPPLRRSKRERRQPTYYGYQCNLTHADEPKTVGDALNSPEWLDAMKIEIDSLCDHNVWELVEPPKDRKLVGSKWVFKVKRKADGSVERCKARLVAQGCSQREGLDYDETFSPVVRPESVRSVIALACKEGLKLHQMDITTAFLNGDLKEEVYIRQPEGFVADGQENLVCRLNKSLYGLKQAPRCWNQVLDSQLKTMGFKQSTSDPCIYTSNTADGLFILAVYVDDILLAGKSQQKIDEVKAELGRRFQLKVMGELHYFLGVSMKQNSETRKTWIGQPA